MLRTVIIAGIALGGCVDEELDVGVETAEIQSEDDANAELRGASRVGVCKMDVVLPPDEDGNSQDPIVCSCLVVSADLVLTSARCVNENVDAGTIGQITIGFGADGNTQTTTAASVELHRYFDKDNPNVFQLAIVRLSNPAPGGEIPVTLNAADISNMAGANVDLVGFGETANDQGNFLRRAVELPINVVERETIRVGNETTSNCAGDSGGGVFHDFGQGPTLIAVSRRQGACSETVSMTRVDRNVDEFLFPYIDQFSGNCPVDGTCDTVDCRTPDPDCLPENGCLWGNACVEDCPTRDWDCPLGSFPGEECAKNGDCEQLGACVAAADDPTFLYCDKPCEVDEDCPAMMTCSGAGRCEYGSPSPGSQGFPCTMNEQCRSGICEDLICVRSCDPNASDCPSEFTCGPSKVADGQFVCLGEDLSGGGGFCQVGSSRGTQTTGLLLLIALLAIRRRRD